MENGTTTGAGAGASGGSAGGGAASPAWSGAVDAGLVSRLQRPARQPGVVRLGHARALLARHRAMVPGVPLAEVLLRRVPDERPAGAETPVVAARPVAAPDLGGTDAGAAPPRADDRPLVPVVPATRVPVPTPNEAQLESPSESGLEPRLEPPPGPGRARPTAGHAAAEPVGADGSDSDSTPIVVPRPSAPFSTGQQVTDPRDAAVYAARAVPPGGPAPSGSRPAAVRPHAVLQEEAVETSFAIPVGPPPRPTAPSSAPAGSGAAPPAVSPPAGPPAVRPGEAVARDAPGHLVPATLSGGALPTPPDLPAAVRPTAVPSIVPRFPDVSPVVAARRHHRLHAVPAGTAGEPGPTPPVVRPFGAEPAAADPGRSAASPVVRPAAAGSGLAEEVHRLVVRELARPAAHPAPALPLPVPSAAPVPATAPPPQHRADAPTVRADRVAERPRRSPPPVDVGRIADAVSRRIAHRGAVEGERRGMNR
jgi:hypothetical protein